MTSPPRARELGLSFGSHDTGTHNTITDVPGVAVGHTTLHQPPDVHTGVTAVLCGDANPHAPLPAGLFSANGFGKFIGATQIAELGEIESPIALTATLSAFRVADALVSWMLARPDCAQLGSFNPVVGECNDGQLSDIRARPITGEHVHAAIDNASHRRVVEGAVGAGTGMVAMGFKAGIGSASRRLLVDSQTVQVGTLVLANFGGTLRVAGRTVAPRQPRQEFGSCVIVVATDLAASARQLTRLARRATYGLGRVGASYSHGSGDYGLAISTTPSPAVFADRSLSPLFEATMDCVEESVLNCLLAAETTTGFDGHVAPGLSPRLLRTE